MAVPLPFKISRAAEEHILALLIFPLSEGFEAGLTLCFASESSSPEGEVTEKFHGQHFCITGNTPEQWAKAHSAVETLITDHAFWIPQESLRALRGKTLTLRPHDVGYGRHAGTMRDLLVAD